jgi:hypothetical protein
MSPARRPPELEVASLHDELVLEAGIILREALARLEARRQTTPAGETVTSYDTCALVSTALELLQRADDVDHEVRR